MTDVHLYNCKKISDRAETGISQKKVINHLIAEVERQSGVIVRQEGENKRITTAFQPVRDWYDGDGRNTDLAKMVALAVADLQDDRKEVLRLRPLLAQREKQLSDDFHKMIGGVDVIALELAKHMECRECSECGGEHHWLPCTTEDIVDGNANHPLVILGIDVAYGCKHCDAWRLEDGEDDYQ